MTSRCGTCRAAIVPDAILGTRCRCAPGVHADWPDSVYVTFSNDELVDVSLDHYTFTGFIKDAETVKYSLPKCSDERLAELEALHVTAEALGPWMSAALADPKACAEFKGDADAFLVALNSLRSE